MAKNRPNPSDPRASLVYTSDLSRLPEGAKVSWKYIHCAGFDDVCKACGDRRRMQSLEARERALLGKYECRKCGSAEFDRLFHHLENIACTCPPGPQEIALTTKAVEVAAAGGRGSGKTDTGFPMTIRGNPDLVAKAFAEGRTPDPIDVSYINDPTYRALVLRKNSKDLGDAWSRARLFYKQFGATVSESDMVVRFPSGAEIVFDHLANGDAWTKYVGQNFGTVWIEECTLIPDELLYIQVKQSCRSANPRIRRRIYLTTNPGGPGHSWFKARFVDVAPQGTVYTDAEGETRIYIHSTMYDNPYFLQGDASALRSLRSIQDENLRRKWLAGDFDALEGQFFTEFRDKPRLGEPAAALHVVPEHSVELLPHWRRWIGMDFGFSHDAAVYWSCHAADQRVYTYREKVESRVGTREWGVRIARASLDDLNGLPNHHMDLFLSPDAFAKRDDENTPAEQIAAGISEVLGQGSVFVMDFTDEERSLPGDRAWESLKSRKYQQQHRTSITIQRAANHRISGWSLMRDMLRWWPTVPEGECEIDPKVADDLLRTRGVLAYAEYVRHIESTKSEVLPKWRILDCCPKLAKGMIAAQHEKGTEDVEKNDKDNEIDAIRYNLMGFDGSQNAIPQSHYVRERVADLPAGASAHSKAMAANYAASQYNKQNQGMRQFNLPRTGGRFRRSLAHVQ